MTKKLLFKVSKLHIISIIVWYETYRLQQKLVKLPQCDFQYLLWPDSIRPYICNKCVIISISMLILVIDFHWHKFTINVTLKDCMCTTKKKLEIW